MNETERAAALARLREADVACLCVQTQLAELDAAIASVDGDHPASAARNARRAELLQLASGHAERAVALYVALYVRSGARELLMA